MLRRFARSIQGKLVGLYLLLIVLSLSTLTYLLYRSTQASLLTSAKASLEGATLNKTETISSWMQEREHDVEVLSKNGMVMAHLSRLLGDEPEGGSRSRDALRALLRLVRDQYGAYHRLSVVTRDGRVAASTDSSMEGRALADPRLLASVRRGQPFTSEVHRRGDALALEIAVPMEPATGPSPGAVLAEVDMGAINQMINSMQLLPPGEVYLVDRRGVLITHHDPRRVFREDLSRIHGVRQVIRGRSGVGEYASHRGVPVLGAYRWMPRWRWGLMAEVEQSKAFAVISKARRELLLIAGLVSVVAILGILLIARQIVRPLTGLTRAAQAIASGKLDQHLEIAGHDEIGYLTECFNKMAESLAESRSALDERIEHATLRLARKNEELARINEELQAANQELERQRAMVAQSARLAAMGEMAAGIAHEINNPLTTMKNLVHSLSGGPPLGGEVGRKDLAIIEEEIDKINRLVVNFLRYARPPKAKKAALDPAALVDKTLELLEPQIRQRRLRIDRQVEDRPPRLVGDREQLGQVYLNLLLNAVQASPEEGAIELFVRTVFANGRCRVELGVTDHGSGIEPGDRARVFKPFFTTKAKGSGLGLAISQRIVQDHGGEISFSSAPGAQTTFVISLDAEERDEPATDR